LSVSILLNLAVLIAYVEAPFLHTHQHEATQRHPGPFLHFHLKSAHDASRTREFRSLDPNEDAQYQTWFRATTPESGSSPAVIPTGPFVLPALQSSARVADPPLPAGHDPPFIGPKNFRAPPA
jgi:hypothetical protein